MVRVGGVRPRGRGGGSPSGPHTILAQCAPPRAGRRPVVDLREYAVEMCAPAGGAAVGRDMQDVVPESRRVSAAAAAGRDARDVVDDGADAGERGEWPGHADRGADARESVMLVTESFRRLPRGTRRKPPSALVAEGATTTTCCGRG